MSALNSLGLLLINLKSSEREAGVKKGVTMVSDAIVIKQLSGLMELKFTDNIH